MSAQDETPDHIENSQLIASIRDDTSTECVGVLDNAESCARERERQATGIIPCCKKGVTVTDRSVSVKRMLSHRRRAKTYSVRRKKFFSKNVRQCSNDDRKRILCYARFLMCLCTAITRHYCTMISNAAQTIPRGIVNGGKCVITGILTTSRDIQWMCAYVNASLALHVGALLHDSMYHIPPILCLFALAASVISSRIIRVMYCLCHVSWLPHF